jgi:drug/metabolite transporter (DMT)-like permease
MSRSSALYLLHFIVFIWGFTGILGHEITLSSVPLVFWRTLIAFCGIAIWVLYKRQWSPISSRHFLGLMMAGLFIAMHWISFFTAIKVSNISTALTVLSTNAIFVSLVGPWIMAKKWDWREMAFGSVAVVGLVFIFNFETRFTQGILWGLLAAFLSATFSAMNARLVKNVPSNQMALIEMAVAWLAVFLYIVLNDNESFQFNQLNSSNVLLLMVLGIVATSFPFIASIAVMRQISPFVCAMAINMEPVYSILLALWLYGQSEYMSLGFYLGGAIILTSTVWLSIKHSKSIG